jgi:hypothetical protein
MDFFDRGRFVAILLLGLVLALIAGAVTKRNAPVLIWFVVIGIGMMAGIINEWVKSNKRRLSKGRKAARGYVILISGLLPYLLGVVLLMVFVSYVVQALLGYPINTSRGRVIGQVIIFSFVAMFIFAFLPYLPTRKHGETSEGREEG